MNDYPPSRMHIKNRAALNEFLDHLEHIGLMQFEFTFNYDLMVEEQPNGNKKFWLKLEYKDTLFRDGKPIKIDTDNKYKNIPGLTHQQRLIRNGEVDDF